MLKEDWSDLGISDPAGLQCPFCEAVETGDVVHGAREMLLMHLMDAHVHEMAQQIIDSI